MAKGAPTKRASSKSQDKELVKVSFYIHRGVYRKLLPLAEKAYMKRSQLMRKIIAEFVDDQESGQRRF